MDININQGQIGTNIHQDKLNGKSSQSRNWGKNVYGILLWVPNLEYFASRFFWQLHDHHNLKRPWKGVNKSFSDSETLLVPLRPWHFLQFPFLQDMYWRVWLLLDWNSCCQLANLLLTGLEIHACLEQERTKKTVPLEKMCWHGTGWGTWQDWWRQVPWNSSDLLTLCASKLFARQSLRALRVKSLS